MASLPLLQLNKDQDRRVSAGHLWIYNNEISAATPLSSFQAGDLVHVVSHRNKSLGIAYINPHTLLCARLLTRDSQQKINADFLSERLQKALTQREMLYAKPYYRWVFAESDLLPGLIIDRFDDVIVAQLNTAGMERLQSEILTAILRHTAPSAVIWRNDTMYREMEQLPLYVKIAYGKAVDEHIVKENGCEFIAALQSGQKTGWFFDHRDNRSKIVQYVKDKTVLDVFSYSGAFALPSAKAGARQVVCVDSSKTAIAYLNKNAELNGVEDRVETHLADAFDFLRDQLASHRKFDVIIIDPPAFIKKKKEYQQGLRAYEKLNQLALSLLNPNGILLSASCSMHLSNEDLLNCIRRASINSNRETSVLEQLHQGRDHPIHPAIPETNYLKGFIVISQ